MRHALPLDVRLMNAVRPPVAPVPGVMSNVRLPALAGTVVAKLKPLPPLVLQPAQVTLVTLDQPMVSKPRVSSWLSLSAVTKMTGMAAVAASALSVVQTS